MKISTVSNDVDIMVACYKMVLEGFSYAVLRQAADDILHGKANGISATFMPSTAELRLYCEKVEGIAKARISYAQSLLDAPEELGRAKRVDLDKTKALISTISNAPASQTRH